MELREFDEWFNELRKEKFPELWQENTKMIDFFWHDYEEDQSFLNEDGQEYVYFLEKLVEELYKDLKKTKREG